MKKNVKLLALLLALTLLAALAGCGASASANGYAMEDAAAEVPMEPYYEEDIAEEAVAEMEAPVPAPASQSQEYSDRTGVTEGAAQADLSEKIIYSAYAEVETTDFDKSVETVYQLMDRYGAFLEASSVNGTNINAIAGSVRSASFILRVPREHYSDITGALSEVGNVTYQTSSADNITSQYTDTASRLKALDVEEERLLEILAQAETVEDMINLESRLSDIRYQKESITSQLKTWDTQVAYSKVDLNLREVKVLTPEPEPEPEGYWAEVGHGFMDTLKWVGRACKGLFRVFVAALPILIPIAVLVIVIVLLVRRNKKKEAEAKAIAAQVKAKAEAEYAREHESKQ